MQNPTGERVQWKDNPNAVELGFDFYLTLIERRLRGERLSLVQSLRRYYSQELGIPLRETQSRGLMHRTSSVFIDYVESVSNSSFVPGIQHWEGQGLEAFLTWREQFYRLRNQQAVDVGDELLEELERRSKERVTGPNREQVLVNRIIRDSALTRFLKALYQSQCQICKASFRLPSGVRYAECHHMRPLGRPHGGLDKETNMLVLCPTHHAMMDFGALAVHPDDLVVLSIERSRPEHHKSLALTLHPLEREFLAYHYSNIFNKVP